MFVTNYVWTSCMYIYKLPWTSETIEVDWLMLPALVTTPN
jgi:hypothetical protein